ncbi:MAG: hypothetical protein H7X99_12110 [Saprospiraceae bacterium]|nr:hypothetical protein [Saprospiraceae bacterium]
MPFQNRVDPYGTLCFSSYRGQLMGNRGHLHKESQQIIRNFQLKRWIICVLDFKQRKRTLMQKGRYTELFFADEATALASGHRPCAECQRSRFNTFSTIWKTANQLSEATTQEIDEYLHKERTNPDKPFLIMEDLPDGVFMEYNSKPYLKNDGKIYSWSFGGYDGPIAWTENKKVKVLTPMSIVKTYSAGFLPDINLITI